MIDQKDRSHSFRMPMIELILVIGIFAVISVFLVQMFMGTSRLQDKANDISRALIQAQTIVEQIKNSASIGETAKILEMDNFDNSSFNYCIYYDSKWNQTKSPSANIIIITSSVDKKENGRLVSAVIKAYDCRDVEGTKDTEALVELTARKWVNASFTMNRETTYKVEGEYNREGLYERES